MSVLDHKTRMYYSGSALLEKFHLNSAHPELHRWIYVLCVPSAVAFGNALVYYSVHGQGARWPALGGSPWAADTFAAPWVSMLANVVATALFVMFVRHKRVRSATKITTAGMLSAAWLFTLISFLVVE